MNIKGVIDKTIRLTKAEKKAFTKARAKERKQVRKREKENLNSMRDLSITNYYFSDGFRRVHPYHHVFKAYAKWRWINRNIFDVLTSEFNVASEEIILSRIASGDIRINDSPTTRDYVFKDLDLMSHRIHRHELPILDLPVNIIHENNDLLVVNKPPSMPAHPCGVYGFNSLLTILAKEMGHDKVRLIHRLDRITSGIMIFCKNYDKANELAAVIKSRNVEKYYLCSVEGDFTAEHGTKVVEVDKPLGPFCAKMGLQWVDEEKGKPSFTAFRGIMYSKELNETLVLCRIYTGRTHQIRIHLQYLGFPIKCDPLYNSEAWGPEKGRFGVYTQPKEKLVEDITLARSKDQYYTFYKDSPQEGPSPPKLPRDEYFDENCDVCNQKNAPVDPPKDNLVLRLHSYHYKLPDIKFTALPFPPWCKDLVRDTEKTVVEEIKQIIGTEFNHIDYKEKTFNSEEEFSS